jgi:hypothetical protein
MRLCTAALGVGLMVGGCATTGPSPDELAKARELTAPEKAALGRIIAASLKDPGAAQFRWMPIIDRTRDGITDYCGLVNSKNSFGGYSGFVRFYVQLSKDDSGMFMRAAVRAIEPPNRETNLLDPRWMNGICENFGYRDFDQAR